MSISALWMWLYKLSNRAGFKTDCTFRVAILILDIKVLGLGGPSAGYMDPNSPAFSHLADFALGAYQTYCPKFDTKRRRIFVARGAHWEFHCIDPWGGSDGYHGAPSTYTSIFL